MTIAKSTKKVSADLSEAPSTKTHGSTDGGTTWVPVKVDSSGVISVASTGVRTIDSSNSTTTNLGNGGVYTGSWVDVLDYSSVIIGILTNQDSATDGFQVQYSSNGTDIHHIHEFTISSNNPNGVHLVFTLTYQYYRIVYTNGTTPQTSFNLSSTLSAQNTTHAHAHSIDFEISGEHVAQVVKAILAGKKPNGDYVNVQTTAGGNLKISVEEFDTAAETQLDGVVAPITTAVSDQLKDYKISNVDADGTPNYYGFEEKDGAWYIMKETLSAGNDTYTYIAGVSDLATSWTGRAGLSYTIFSSAF